MSDVRSVISSLAARSSGALSRTSSCVKAEAAADVAALKVKLKYVDIESTKRAELDRLSTVKQLDMAQARLNAISQIDHEDTLPYGKDSDDMCPPPIPIELQRCDVDKDVQDYIRSLPLEHTQGQVVNSSVPLNDTVQVVNSPGIHSCTKLNTSAKEFVPKNETSVFEMERLTNALAQQISLGRLPPPEPGVFYGDPLTYPSWKVAFETLIERKGISPAERIYYLKRYLGGSAKESVEGYILLCTDESYDQAKALLDKRFGNSFVVANAFRDKLESWPKITRDGAALRKFSDFLRQCLAAMETINSLNVLNDDRENQKILLKLPDWLIHRWGRIVASWRDKHQVFPPFSEFVSFIAKEADIACDPVTAFLSAKSNSNKTELNQSNKFRKRASGTSFSTEVTVSRQIQCVLCKGNHDIDSCKSFLAKPVKDRKEFAKDRWLCFGCLKEGHRSRECTKRNKCKTCSKYHPTSLHGDLRETETASPNDTIAATSTHSSVTHLSKTGTGDKCSMIIPVWLSHCDRPESEHLIYALLDTQSDTTFVLSKTCNDLELQGPSVHLMLSTMSAKDELVKSTKINGLVVRGFDSSIKINLPATYSREIMPANKKHIPTPERANMWPHLECIADKLMPLNSDIDVGLLIGYNCARALTPRDVIPPINDDAPYGQRTDLGWGIVGIVDYTQIDSHDDIGVSHRVMAREVPIELRRSSGKDEGVLLSLKTSIKEVFVPCDVTQMMELDFSERTSNQVSLSCDDRKFLNNIERGIHQLTDGHYEMPLPFRESEPKLPNNRLMASQRLKSLKKRFQKDSKYREDYNLFMQNIIQSGHAEKVPHSELACDDNVWYIPHHGVYHPKKPDKIRVVFDCSAKFEGVSLNDYLLQGPDLTNALVGVLCRFRKEPIAMMCDIEQMFHQFKVNECHRNFLRFLWWETEDLDSEPVEFRMTVHLFGATSSPGCANFGLKQVANDYEPEFGAAAANFLRNDFYVDDGLKSLPTVDETVDLIEASKKLCRKGGLRLHKFISNSKDVIASIPIDDCAKAIKNIDLLHDLLPIERVLGVNWCIELDCFQFRITLKDQPLVRRGVLSTINSVYDPLGFVAPVMLKGKQILQEMCKDQLDWDSPLPDALRMRWENWRSKLFLLENNNIPRCFKPDGFGKVQTTELHHFADASTSGYGQCSYLRLVDDKENVHCSFVMGKARVAPLKTVTIPRLELTAALVSTKVSATLQREIDYTDITETFWTDSQIVLSYIANETQRFHIFVANRVQQIREHTDPSQWKYVKSEENPADCASRGLSVTDLNKSKWLTGPDFLWNSVSPLKDELEIDLSLSSDDPEIKKVKTLASNAEEQPVKFELKCLEHCSKWHRAKKAIALCLKLKKKLQKQISATNDATHVDTVEHKSVFKSIDVDDLHQAGLEIVRLVQAETFHEELKTLNSLNKVLSDKCERQNITDHKKALKGTSLLCKLDPYIDTDGILRVGGRIHRACISDSLKHPVILPRKHHITTLIIRHFHERVCHQGRGMTTNAIRSNGFWIIGCGSAVSHFISKCVKCRKLRSSVQEQKMADLPTDRMEEAPPFSFCGVDIFGPFYIKEGRKELKRYGALFTCLVSRAIHIEITNSLSTDSFINALRRFLAIRGPIRQLRCDRGTNFVGAQRELQEMDNLTVNNFLLKENCDYFPFKMNVPSASHMGGVWERQIRTVRSVLSHLMDQLGQLDDEGLRTLMCEAMAIVNSRPLTVDNLNDPTSLEPLTPNHLLTGKTNVILPPPGNFQRADLYSRKQWRRVQHLANEFWHRWRREFLHTLQVRQKWLYPRRIIQNGDIVLIKDENLPRNLWQLARVCETHLDEDGLVRKVKVVVGDKTLSGDGKRKSDVTYLERPIQKLILLLESEDISE